MRISLFLNSTMSKSCVQPQEKEWFHQERKLLTNSSPDKRHFSYSASSSKERNSFYSISSPANRIGQFPAFLNACYELQWFINSRTTLSQALGTAVKQIYSLSGVLLLYFTLILVLAQVAGLFFILSQAVTVPIGFQFMLGAVIFISATAFKIMY